MGIHGRCSWVSPSFICGTRQFLIIAALRRDPLLHHILQNIQPILHCLAPRIRFSQHILIKFINSRRNKLIAYRPLIRVPWDTYVLYSIFRRSALNLSACYLETQRRKPSEPVSSRDMVSYTRRCTNALLPLKPRRNNKLELPDRQHNSSNEGIIWCIQFAAFIERKPTSMYIRKETLIQYVNSTCARIVGNHYSERT